MKTQHGHGVLIGGKALVELGSSRSTNDTDYLVFIEDNFEQFIFDEENHIDYMNGNGSNFAEEIWNKEKDNEIASPQSLYDLKAWAMLSHFRNGNNHKLNDCIFDLRFLAINHGIEGISTLKKYITKEEAAFIAESVAMVEQ